MAGRIISRKNSIHTIGKGIHDLPDCSAVPQTTAPPRGPIYVTIVPTNTHEYIAVSLCTQRDPTCFDQPWSRTWPQRVGVGGVNKLTSTCSCAFVGTVIVYI